MIITIDNDHLTAENVRAALRGLVQIQNPAKVNKKGVSATE